MSEGINKDVAKKCHQLAKRYYEEGLAVLPVKLGTKGHTLIPWGKYNESRPEWSEIEDYFRKGASIAILCGTPSGGLVVFDFDEMKYYEQFLEKHPEIQNTRIVKTHKGVHVYFRMDNPPRKMPLPKVDIQGEKSLVMAPPSPHPDGGYYEFLHDAPIQHITQATFDEYLQAVSEITGHNLRKDTGKNTKVVVDKSGRILSQRDINKILEVMQSYYIRGYRNHIVLFLSGWLYKSGVSYESAKKIIEALAEQDEEKKQRLYVLERTYKNQPPEKIKGITGLQEVLELVNETKGISSEESKSMTLHVIRTLQGVIGIPSPFGDAVVYEYDAEARIYAVADPVRKEIYQARYNPKEGRLIRKKEIIESVPLEVTGIYDPFNQSAIKYIVTMEDKAGQIRSYGPASLPDIVKTLNSNSLVKSRNLAYDYLAGIIRQYILAGKGEIKTQTTAPGFFLHNEELINNIMPEEADGRKLVEALEFLDALIRREFKDSTVKRKIAMVVKWATVAPFSFIRKELYPEKRQPWVYLVGPTNTGKTTIGMIGCYLWWDPPPDNFIIPFSKVNTEPRLGEYLSKTTLPYIFDEADLRPYQRNNRTTYLDALKDAISGKYARGRYENMVYVDIPAFAPVIFTSNHSLPSDEALMKRLLLITFSRNEIIPDGPTKKRFIHTIIPQLPKLKEIGKAIYMVVKVLYTERGKSIFQEDWERLAEEILTRIYDKLGLDVPDWIEYHYEEQIETEEEISEEIRAWVIDEINRAYRQIDYYEKQADIDEIRGLRNSEEFYGYEYESWRQKVIKVLAGNYISWATLRESNKEQTVIIFRSIISKLPGHLREGIQDNLKAIAEILQSEGITAKYKQVKVNGKNSWRIVIPLESFVMYLQRIPQEPKQKNLIEVMK